MEYNARFYSPSLGKFVSADTLIPDPGNVLAWDRYGYVLNNPINRIDPTGHWSCGDAYDPACYEKKDEGEFMKMFLTLLKYEIDEVFDPFYGAEGGLSRMEEMEIAYQRDRIELLAYLYDKNGINLENYHLRDGNPLEHSDVQEFVDEFFEQIEMNNMLFERQKYGPYLIVLNSMNVKTTEYAVMNFEPNYLDKLMKNNKGEFETAKVEFINLMIEGSSTGLHFNIIYEWRGRIELEEQLSGLE